MLINGIDTLEYKAELQDRSIENSEITTEEEWIDGWISPFFHEQYFKYNTVTCEFLLETKNDDMAEKNISRLIKKSSRAELEFDDLSFKYFGNLETVSKEKIITGKYILNMSWNCMQGYEDEANATIQNGTIELSSTAVTPIIIEINPSTDIEIANIKGFGEDIVIKNLTPGKKIIIDGEIGLVTEDGVNKYDDYESWGFPKLLPGINEINSDIELIVRYKPRWL